MTHADAIRAKLEALAAKPREWRVTTVYQDGAVRVLDQPTEKQAENYASRERLKVGKDLISRETGLPVRVVSVTVGRIAA